MARKTTRVAFDKWVAEDGNLALILELVAGGKTLRDACFSQKQPYTCMHEYLHSTPERRALYEQARAAWADEKMDEALAIADGVAADKDEVAKAKLQVDTRYSQAKAYHRLRWGETLQVEKNVTVAVDVGPATRLLQEARLRELTVDQDGVAVPLLAEKPAG